MDIEVIGGRISEKEKLAYVDYVRSKNRGSTITSLTIKIDGAYVDLSYRLIPTPFERIRRITGYLVGKTDRWNSGKLSELRDRETHGM